MERRHETVKGERQEEKKVSNFPSLSVLFLFCSNTYVGGSSEADTNFPLLKIHMNMMMSDTLNKRKKSVLMKGEHQQPTRRGFMVMLCSFSNCGGEKDEEMTSLPDAEMLWKRTLFLTSILVKRRGKGSHRRVATQTPIVV